MPTDGGDAHVKDYARITQLRREWAAYYRGRGLTSALRISHLASLKANKLQAVPRAAI